VGEEAKDLDSNDQTETEVKSISGMAGGWWTGRGWGETPPDEKDERLPSFRPSSSSSSSLVIAFSASSLEERRWGRSGWKVVQDTKWTWARVGHEGPFPDSTDGAVKGRKEGTNGMEEEEEEGRG